MTTNVKTPAAVPFDISRTFGVAKTPAAATKVAAEDRPKAAFWLNVGYSVPVEYTDPTTKQVVQDTRFISLPVGIPLDTMAKHTLKGSNAEYLSMLSASNDLWDQIMAVAAKMAPGEDHTLQLEVQIRRVNDAPAIISSDANPFSRTLNLLGEAGE